MKKLCRTSYNKQIAGVCNGISEYFEIDVTLVRLAFAICVFFGGIGIFAYILGYFIMPEKRY